MKEYSWADPPYSNDDAYTELCEQSKPSDFYFCAIKDIDGCSYGETMIGIVPKEYFDSFGFMWDQTMFLEHILPEDFSESMECIWDSDRPAPSVRQEMLALGFEENEKFSKLFKKDFDYEEGE